MTGHQKFETKVPVYQIGRVADRYQPPPREQLGDLDQELWPDGKDPCALCQKQTLCRSRAASAENHKGPGRSAASRISDKSSSGRTSFTAAIMHISKATSRNSP
jgi:hypothetical protein